MKFVTKPSIFFLAETSISPDSQVTDWLQHMGSQCWSSDAGGAEMLIEMAGRRCYQSFEIGMNPNITRIREGNHNYIGNILNQKHGSVLEHGYVTFAFEDVSRVFTHELVRHRLCNYSQESMRFVRPTSLKTIFPDIYASSLSPEKYERVLELFEKAFTDAEEIQKELINVCGLDNKDMPFHLKKLFQSANRRAIPDGVLTGIVTTTNHRNLRHLIELRTSMGAEEEIRYVFSKVAEFVFKRYAALYQDFEQSEEREIYGEKVWVWTSKNGKI